MELDVDPEPGASRTRTPLAVMLPADAGTERYLAGSDNMLTEVALIEEDWLLSTTNSPLGGITPKAVSSPVNGMDKPIVDSKELERAADSL